MTRILIVDDHPVVRRGLSQLIDLEEDLEICGEAGDAPTAMEKVKTAKPDLALIDISLKDVNGIELVKQIKSRAPTVRMLVCSMHDEMLYAERALRAGAMGYINKAEASEKVIDAIRAVLGGKMFLSERMHDRILHRVADGQSALDRSAVENLTDRELEVFELLGEGLGTRDIASRLHLSSKTIDAYRQRIKAKLQLANSNELVQHAVRWVVERTGPS